jgi:cell division protein FtsL
MRRVAPSWLTNALSDGEQAMTRSKYLCGLFLLASMPRAFAQEDTRQLKAEVDQLRVTVQALQVEVKTLKDEQAKAGITAAVAESSLAATATVAPISMTATATTLPVSPTQANPQESYTTTIPNIARSPLPAQESVSENANAASRIDNEAPPTDPDLKGFILIPGTQTLIRLGGYAKLDAIYDTNTIGNPDQFVMASIPVPAPHDDTGNFNLQARQTRFSLEVRRPTIFDENMRFYFENDFYGGGNGQYQFRLRQAFGQLGNTYAGYGFSSFVDVDALPDTLDFAGPGGAVALSQAGIHQIFRVGDDGSFTVAAEKPTAEVSSIAPDSNVRGAQHVPDVVLAARTEHEWGHLQWSAVLRQLGYTDGEHGDQTLGGGTSFAGAIKTGGSSAHSDLLMFGGVWGKGISRYVGDTGGSGLDAAIGPDGRLHAITSWGSYAAYTHYWTSDWRSNLVYGVTRILDSPFIATTAFRNSAYGAANLIWSPISTLTVGVELLHGQLQEQNIRKNDDTRIQGSLQYNFIK